MPAWIHGSSLGCNRELEQELDELLARLCDNGGHAYTTTRATNWNALMSPKHYRVVAIPIA